MGDDAQWLDWLFDPQHIDLQIGEASRSEEVPTPDWPGSIYTESEGSGAVVSHAKCLSNPPETAGNASQYNHPPPSGHGTTSYARKNRTSDIGDGGAKNGWLTPLHSAAACGHARIVHVLLQHQSQETECCNARDSDGLTPLAHAIGGGYEDVLLLLLSHGARLSDVVVDPDGQSHSALHWAVRKRRETCLRVLLEHCDSTQDLLGPVDEIDREGRTPLHLAAETGFEAAVVILLQHGADPNSRAFKAR